MQKNTQKVLQGNTSCVSLHSLSESFHKIQFVTNMALIIGIIFMVAGLALALSTPIHWLKAFALVFLLCLVPSQNGLVARKSYGCFPSTSASLLKTADSRHIVTKRIYLPPGRILYRRS